MDSTPSALPGRAVVLDPAPLDGSPIELSTESEEALLTDEIAQPDSQRASARTDVFSGRVTSSLGSVVPAATISWTAFTEPGETVLADRTLWARSDEEGRFAFAEVPDGIDGRESVLWITHPDHLAHAVVLEADRSHWKSADHVLSPASPARALVTRRGAAAAEVVVEQRILDAPDISDMVRLAFSRESRTDGEGRAILHPVAGTQRILARSEGDVSPPWVGSAPELVHLELLPAFSASGTIAWVDQPHDVPLSIRCEAIRGSKRIALTTTAASSSGEWELPALPLLDAATYRFQLEGEGIVPDTALLESPAPGERVLVELRAQVGLAVWLWAQDEQDEVLLEAEGLVRWEEDGLVVERRARARADGYIEVKGCRPGVITYEVRCPGYRSETSENLVIPEPEPETHVVRLEKGGVLRGRCVFEGRPVEDFEVLAWASEQTWNVVREEVNGSADGSFEFAGVSLGPTSVIAAAVGYSQSAETVVDVRESVNAPVLLELRREVRGIGRVVDVDSRDALLTASVQVWSSSSSGDLVAKVGTPERVDQDGRFEIRGLQYGNAALVVSAPGYSSQKVYVPVTGEQADAGVVSLARAQPLEVQLLTPPGVDPAGCRLEITTDEDLQPEFFDSGGFVRYEAASIGLHSFLVNLPDRSRQQTRAWLQPGHVWKVVVDARGSARLTVRVDPRAGETLPASLRVALAFLSGEMTTLRWGALSDGGECVFDSISAGTYQIEVLDDAGQIAAGSRIALHDDEGRELHLVIGSDARRFRVVTPDGAPAPGTSVGVFLPGDLLAIADVTADAAGEFSLFGLPPGTVEVQLLHDELGTRMGLNVDLPEDTGALIELVLEAGIRVDFFLERATGPVVGVPTQLSEPLGRFALHGPYSDERGRVVYDNMGPGDCLLGLSESLYWPVRQPVTLARGMGPVVVPVHQRTALTVQTRSVNGLPVAHVPFDLVWSHTGEDLAVQLETRFVVSSTGKFETGADGSVLLEGLPEGRYAWSAASAGVEGTVELVGGRGGNDLVIVLP